MAGTSKTQWHSLLLTGLALGLAGIIGCWTGHGPTESKTGAAGKNFSLGRYELDAAVEGLPGLVEWSGEEYEGMGRLFRGEKNYNAPPVSFLGHQWKLIIGTVNGKIYKLAPNVQFKDKPTATEALNTVVRFYRESLGQPSKPQPGLYVWDSPKVNVILQTAEASDGFGLQLFLTSTAASSFPTIQ